MSRRMPVMRSECVRIFFLFKIGARKEMRGAYQEDPTSARPRSLGTLVSCTPFASRFAK
jgi:hypothetical protein